MGTRDAAHRASVFWFAGVRSDLTAIWLIARGEEQAVDANSLAAPSKIACDRASSHGYESCATDFGKMRLSGP